MRINKLAAVGALCCAAGTASAGGLLGLDVASATQVTGGFSLGTLGGGLSGGLVQSASLGLDSSLTAGGLGGLGAISSATSLGVVQNLSAGGGGGLTTLLAPSAQSATGMGLPIASLDAVSQVNMLVGTTLQRPAASPGPGGGSGGLALGSALDAVTTLSVLPIAAQGGLQGLTSLTGTLPIGAAGLQAGVVGQLLAAVNAPATGGAPAEEADSEEAAPAPRALNISGVLDIVSGTSAAVGGGSLNANAAAQGTATVGASY
jgi:hypothetical protein